MSWLENHYGDIIVIVLIAILLFVCWRSLKKNPECSTCGKKGCSGCGLSMTCALGRAARH